MIQVMIFFTSLWTGIEVAKWIPTDWVGSIVPQKYQAIVKLLISIVGFIVGFIIGEFVFWFIAVYVIVILLKK
jgi:hypothetical protein